MAIQELTDEQIREWTIEQKDRWWLENVYRGDMPQLTLRSAVTGFLLGGVLSATNLYIGAKTGWSLGVGITSVILAFAIFRMLQRFGVREFTILENNAMQSIATSAGYMTAPLISSLAAYMIVNQRLLPWWQIILWNAALSVLGVLFAFPLKRRFINDEQHPFPEGKAAGFVMESLHTSDAAAGLFKARVLAFAAGTAAFIKFLQAESIQILVQGKLLRVAEEKVWHLKEDLFEMLGLVGERSPKIRGVPMEQLTVSPGLDIALMGAGGLMGMRAASSLLLGAIINFVILAPWMVDAGEIQRNAEGYVSFRQITMWSLWPGVAAMVVASFVPLFAKPKVILSAFHGLIGKKRSGEDVLKHVEFPLWISAVGIPVMSLVCALLARWFFGIHIWVSLIGLPLTFVLSLVAANSTALTSTTPVGATSKITQLFYGLVRPGDIHANLATAGITAEVVSNSSNLLMDIKPGYMLGAKPRQQAIGHIIGIFSGAIASTLLFFPLFVTGQGVDPSDPATIANLQSKQFPMPSVTVWKGVAELLSKGLDQLPESVVMAVIVAGLAALVLEVLRILSRNRLPLSPVAIGLAFVIDFRSAFCMWLGAFLFFLLGVGRLRGEKARGNLWVENHESICAGIIAGASLMGIMDIIVGVFLL
ncbi:MAG: OPT/YSL family transporter [Planctomycetaceae bacterium]|nr:OPT/YSL family transporter [Planctomycetaceae bacterium]